MPTSVRIFSVAFLILFLELLLIRWISAHVRILAYFANFVLIASFAGIGMGSLLVRSKLRLIRLWPVGLLGLLVLTAVFKSVYVKPIDSDILFQEIRNPANSISLHILLAIFYLALLTFFIPGGMALGQLLHKGVPLKQYIWSLMGSLAGIASISIGMYAGVPPVYLFAICAFLMLLILYFMDKKLWIYFGSIILAVCLALVWQLDRGATWSPYHKITLSPLLYEAETGKLVEKYAEKSGKNIRTMPIEVGFNISVNDDYLQMALDLSDDSIKRIPTLEKWKIGYERPFRIVQPDRALILAGGVGNDAAAALRLGVQQIDVVDIEPLIIKLGKKSHPEKPYANPQVRIFVNDARAYLENSDEKYDLIVMSLLDSHRLYSQMSSVRLDSFLYTLESFQAALRLLKPRGVLYVHNAAVRSHVGPRLFAMLERICPNRPLVLDAMVAPAIICNAGSKKLSLKDEKVFAYHNQSQVIHLATDNWPFIYLKERSIPSEYLYVILMAVGLTLALLLLILRSKVLSIPRESYNLQAMFFLIGLGFFLLESRAITSLGLLFGSTWYVNALVLFAMLLASTIATFYVLRNSKIQKQFVFYCLIALLLVFFFLPLHTILTLTLSLRVLIAIAMVGLPIVCSGILFASIFQSSSQPALHYGINILGSVCGGFTEYICMVFGHRILFILLIFIYGLFFYLMKGRQESKPDFQI